MAEGKLEVASPVPAIPAPKRAEREESGGYDVGVAFGVPDAGDPRDARGMLRYGSVPGDFARLGGGRGVGIPSAEGR